MTKDVPATVPSVDLQRYLGTWYEIARLPMRHEPPEYTDITATYAMDPEGRLRVENRARNAKGEMEEAIGQATPVDTDNARLRVSFLPEGLRWIPFASGDYWILRLDPDYRIALVGSPDRRHLWLLSRSAALPEPVIADYLSTATDQGYRLDRLIRTPQPAAR